ncbi:hypothetical protein ACWE42_15030 [Sutcliffiella cohnii]
MIIQKPNLLKRFKKPFIIIMLIQTLFFIPCSVFFLVNELHVMEGTEKNIQKLEEQKELFKTVGGWILFGPWNALLINQINKQQEKIIEKINKEKISIEKKIKI